MLLVDDSEFVLGVYADLLKNAGFDVRTATDVADCAALIDDWPPHLVLTDVQLRGASGETLCRRLKARHPSLPVIFVSELPAEELAARAKAGGADAFLSKSSDWAAFVEFVRNICAITYSPEDLP